MLPDPLPVPEHGAVSTRRLLREHVRSVDGPRPGPGRLPALTPRAAAIHVLQHAAGNAAVSRAIVVQRDMVPMHPAEEHRQFLDPTGSWSSDPAYIDNLGPGSYDVLTGLFRFTHSNGQQVDFNYSEVSEALDVTAPADRPTGQGWVTLGGYFRDRGSGYIFPVSITPATMPNLARAVRYVAARRQATEGETIIAITSAVIATSAAARATLSLRLPSGPTPTHGTAQARLRERLNQARHRDPGPTEEEQLEALREQADTERRRHGRLPPVQSLPGDDVPSMWAALRTRFAAAQGNQQQRADAFEAFALQMWRQRRGNWRAVRGVSRIAASRRTLCPCRRLRHPALPVDPGPRKSVTCQQHGSRSGYSHVL